MIALQRILAWMLFGAMVLPSLTPPQTQALLAQSVEINIWPEYDQPSVLVTYDIELAESASLPAQVAIRIPIAAQKVHSLIYMEQPDSAPIPLTHRPYLEDRWLRIVFTTPTRYLHIEFYDPRLNLSQARRTYTYEWPGDFSVQQFIVHIQEPAGATQMQIPARFQAGIKGSDGLTYHTADLEAMDAGDAFTFTIGYEKTGNQPSFTQQNVQPNIAINNETPGRFNMRSLLPWLLSGFGALCLLTLLFTLLLRRLRLPGNPNNRNPTSPTPTPHQGLHCPTCGHSITTADRYCRACGVRLKS